MPLTILVFVRTPWARSLHYEGGWLDKKTRATGFFHATREDGR